MKEKLLFCNERVKVTDVVVEAAAFYEYKHTFPCVRWSVGDATLLISENSEAQKLVNSQDRDVFWVNEQTVWKIINKGETEFRQIVFEILQKPKYSENEAKQLLQRCIYSTDVGTKKLFENEYVRVWDFFYEAGDGDPTLVHQHTLDYVFVIVGTFPQRLFGYNPDGSLQFDSSTTDGDTEWTYIPNGGFKSDNITPLKVAYHAVMNGSSTHPFVEYLVELK